MTGEVAGDSKGSWLQGLSVRGCSVIAVLSPCVLGVAVVVAVGFL